MIKLNELLSGKIKLDKIQVKNYLSFIEKQSFIEDVKNVCIVKDESPVIVVDYVCKQMIIEFLFCKNYANIDVDLESIIETYDALKEKGIVKHILEKIPEHEKNTIFEAIDKELEQEIMIAYKIENVIHHFLSEILEGFASNKIDTWIKNITQSLKNFSPENYKKLNELMDFSKGKDLEEK